MIHNNEQAGKPTTRPEDHATRSEYLIDIFSQAPTPEEIEAAQLREEHDPQHTFPKEPLNLPQRPAQ